MRDVDAVVAFTERDRTALLPLAGRTPVVPIPFGTVVPRRPLNPVGAEAPTIVFVGSFRHYPNLDGAMRLITGIFPLVRARCQGARLAIIGSDPPASLHEAAADGIEVLGSVPDITEQLDRASVVVAPLRLGGGMRVKVIEALAAGKAVVCSRLAIEGLDVADGEEVRLAETDGEFADAVVELLERPDLRQALAGRARAWACTNAGWDRPVAAYEALYDSLAGVRA
jgi:glycosyltransferase involved in cell wall biosynthesis